MIRVCGYLCCVRCVFYLVWCSLTYEHREEENGHRDVEDRTGDVKEPVRSHREETEEKEEEEQTATVFLHLTGEGRRKTGEKRTKMVRRIEGKVDESRKRMKKKIASFFYHRAAGMVNGDAYLPLQQVHFIREELNHMLLPKRSGEQVAERGARRGEQAGQHQTLPGPEYGTS